MGSPIDLRVELDRYTWEDRYLGFLLLRRFWREFLGRDFPSGRTTFIRIW